jgi:hypothetical protein
VCHSFSQGDQHGTARSSDDGISLPVTDTRTLLNYYRPLVNADPVLIFDHEWLLRMLARRVDDKPFLGLIDTWLKTGILERDATVINVTSPTGGQVMTQSTKPSWRMI